MRRRGDWRVSAWLVLTLLALGCVLTAIVGAQEPALRPGVDLVLLIDHSLSMHGYPEQGITNIDPDNERIAIAQRLVNLLAEDARIAPHDHRVAIIAFGGASWVQHDMALLDPYSGLRGH